MNQALCKDLALWRETYILYPLELAVERGKSFKKENKNTPGSTSLHIYNFSKYVLSKYIENIVCCEESKHSSCLELSGSHIREWSGKPWEFTFKLRLEIEKKQPEGGAFWQKE